jgi:transcriptional regulator with XRE-family HTH domain
VRPMDYRELGLYIREKRRRKQLTQEQVAQQAHVSRNWVSLLERGKLVNITVDSMVNVALAVGVDPVTLLKVHLLANKEMFKGRNGANDDGLR